MCKVFLYSRVSTDQQTLAQQERTAYEWLKAHNMKVDEIVSDEGVSGGVSYADRNLGKILLPKTKEGDMIIVSEISRLGRSMFNLSELIHKELKPRKIRLVCCTMGIDLDCSKMTAIDELIISNFSFAAQLEKQLISERTLSALQVKRKQGVKLGGASDKWRETFNNKSKEQFKKECMQKGHMKNERHIAKKETQAFLRILRNLFPDACSDENPVNWNWKGITTAGDNKDNLVRMIKDYQSMDDTGTLFRKWKFDEWTDRQTQVRLCAHISNLKVSFKSLKRHQESNNNN